MRSLTKDIILIIPYFGKFPWYFKYFLHSCKHNPTVDFLILSDIIYEDADLPENVTLHRTSIAELEQKISNKLGFTITIPYTYKLCDFKPVLGYVFSDMTSKYKFWGYGDLDVVYGDIKNFITNDILEQYDTISIRNDYVTGFFQLFRNSPELQLLFTQSRDYKKVFTSPQHYCFDETNFTFDLFSENISYKKIYCEVESMTHVVKRLEHSHQLKPYFGFHAVEGRPGNLRWQDGKLFWKIPKPAKQVYESRLKPGNYEILLYHLISFKHAYRPTTVNTIPDTFLISRNSIEHVNR